MEIYPFHYTAYIYVFPIHLPPPGVVDYHCCMHALTMTIRRQKYHELKLPRSPESSQKWYLEKWSTNQLPYFTWKRACCGMGNAVVHHLWSFILLAPMWQAKFMMVYEVVALKAHNTSKLMQRKNSVCSHQRNEQVYKLTCVVWFCFVYLHFLTLKCINILLN